MVPRETAALRHLIAQYLAGEEPIEAAAPRFRDLLFAWFEANYQARSKGQPPLPEPEPPNLTDDERRRMRDLHLALLDHLPGPAIEWLPAPGDDVSAQVG